MAFKMIRAATAVALAAAVNAAITDDGMEPIGGVKVAQKDEWGQSFELFQAVETGTGVDTYEVVDAKSIPELETDVNDAIDNDNMALLGDFAVVQTSVQPPLFRYFQAMAEASV